MSGTHPLVRSMVVSVYYFTLLGNSVDICQPDLFSGPFLTYVLETDTYQSFMERVVKITGESISKLWNDSRLAVVRKRVPHFLPRPTFIDDQVDSKDAAGSKRKLDGRNTTEDSTSAADGVTGDQDSTKRDSKESNEEKDNYSLWKYFVEHYPGNARDGDINEKYHSQEIPQVGIQRSVSDKSFANR